MLKHMSAREFAEWREYHNHFQPFGEFRADLRGGVIASQIINTLMAGFGFKSPTWKKPEDFMLQLGPKKPQTTAEMQEICKAMAEGAKIAQAKFKKAEAIRKEQLKKLAEKRKLVSHNG